MGKQKYTLGKSSGFTLLELIIALAILSIIAVAVSSVFIYGPSSYSTQVGNVSAQHQARSVMRHISKDIRAVDKSEIEITNTGLEIADKVYKFADGKIYRNETVIAQGMDEFTYTFTDNHLFVQTKITNRSQKQYVLQSDFYIRGEGK